MAAKEAVTLLRGQLGRGSTGCGRSALFTRPDFINSITLAAPCRSSTISIQQLAQSTSFYAAPRALAPRRSFSSSSTARARLVDDRHVSPTFGAREPRLPPGERDKGIWACLAGETARALWRQAKARVEAEERQRAGKRTNFVSAPALHMGSNRLELMLIRAAPAYLETGRVPILPALARKAAVQPRLAMGQTPFRSRQAHARLAPQERRQS